MRGMHDIEAGGVHAKPEGAVRREPRHSGDVASVLGRRQDHPQQVQLLRIAGQRVAQQPRSLADRVRWHEAPLRQPRRRDEGEPRDQLRSRARDAHGDTRAQGAAGERELVLFRRVQPSVASRSSTSDTHAASASCDASGSSGAAVSPCA